MVVAAPRHVLQRPERVEAREQRGGQAAAVGVEPQRRRAGQDADAVVRPDGGVVRDALGVVPHPVLVHERGPGVGRDAEHEAVGRVGDPGQHALGQGAGLGVPVRTRQVVVGADAAGRDDDGARRDLLGPHHVAVRRRAAAAERQTGERLVGQHLGPHAGDAAVRGDELRDPPAEPQVEQAGVAGLLRGRHEGGDDAGAGAPGDVEARHGVTVLGPAVVVAHRVPAALGPLHQREPAHALAVQPRAQVARGELDEAPRPRVAVPVGALAAVGAGRELCRAQPVRPRQVGGVVHAHRALLRGADEEQAAERPPGLAAGRRLRLLVEQHHPAAGGGELRCRDEPRQAPTDDDDVSIHARSLAEPGRAGNDAETSTRCIPKRYRSGMTTQIAVRLPDELVAWVDQQVAEGKTRSRASAVERALRREVRRQLAERDAQIYAAMKPEEDELSDMVRWVEKNSSWDHLD